MRTAAKALTGSLILAIAGFLAYNLYAPQNSAFLFSSAKPEAEVAAARAMKGVPVYLYYYNPAMDTNGNGNVECSSQGLVGVPRSLPADAHMQDVIELLLQGQLSNEEKAQGITTEFPLSGFRLSSATFEGSTLTLAFDDPESKTSGGACRVAILKAEIEATARQFSSVDDIRFEPETLFQP